MQQVYKAKFDNGETVSFYVNDLSGYFYGELWILNPQQIEKNKFSVAETYEFKDDTLKGFMNKITSFIKERTDLEFTIETK